jgi:hypothetical protein
MPFLTPCLHSRAAWHTHLDDVNSLAGHQAPKTLDRSPTDKSRSIGSSLLFQRSCLDVGGAVQYDIIVSQNSARSSRIHERLYKFTSLARQSLCFELIHPSSTPGLDSGHRTSPSGKYGLKEMVPLTRLLPSPISYLVALSPLS